MKEYRFTKRGRVQLMKRAMLDHEFVQSIKKTLFTAENCRVETPEIVQTALDELEKEGLVEEVIIKEGAK